MESIYDKIMQEYKSGYLKNQKISASQLSTWIKSKKDYEKQYIIGEPFIGNKYTDFGSKIHKLIETLDDSVSHVRKLKNKEFYFEDDVDDFKINGYLDSYELGEIIDYKISKKGKWSDKIVNKNVQFKFYGYWHKIKHGTLPKISVIHIESDEKFGELYLTGNVYEYSYTPTEEDIEFIKNNIKEFILWCENYKQNGKAATN